jgi:ABC-type transport system involved in multi-copper enzyme maturation permease subunit
MNGLTLAAAIGAGIAIVAVYLLSRRVLAWTFGPFFEWEMARLGRRGRIFWYRVALALLLLVLLYSVTPEIPFMDALSSSRGLLGIGGLGRSDCTDFDIANEYTRFAGEFADSLLLALGMVAMIIAPIYFGAAVSDEKEKRSIEVLLATPITGREFVLGKFAARLLSLFAVGLAALPILALTLLWGGVDWRQVLTGFAIISATVISYGSVGILCSVVFARTRNAVITAFMLILLINIACTFAGRSYLFLPVINVVHPRDWSIENLQLEMLLESKFAAFLRTMEDNAEDHALAGLLCFHGIVAIVCLPLSIGTFRYFARRRQQGHRPEIESKTPPPSTYRRFAHSNWPPFRDNPLIWKEGLLGCPGTGAWPGREVVPHLYLIATILVFAAILEAQAVSGDDREDIEIAMRLATVALGTFVALGIGLRLSASISRERQQQTLSGLLTSAFSHEEIFLAKWVGALIRFRHAIVGLIALFLVTSLFGKYTRVTWVLFPLTFVAHIWFVGNLGLFLSVRCSSASRAIAFFLSILLAIVAASEIDYYLDFPSYQQVLHPPPGSARISARIDFEPYHRYFDLVHDHSYCYLNDFINPPETWWHLTAPNGSYFYSKFEGDPTIYSPDKLPRSWGWYIVAAWAYGALGTGLFVLSVRLFRREGARS